MPETLKILFGLCISFMFLAVAFALGVIYERSRRDNYSEFYDANTELNHRLIRENDRLKKEIEKRRKNEHTKLN